MSYVPLNNIAAESNIILMMSGTQCEDQSEWTVTSVTRCDTRCPNNSRRLLITAWRTVSSPPVVITLRCTDDSGDWLSHRLLSDLHWDPALSLLPGQRLGDTVAFLFLNSVSALLSAAQSAQSNLLYNFSLALFMFHLLTNFVKHEVKS